MNKEKKIPGHILSLFIILLSISGVCLLMYKAQFRFNLHQPIEYVMMTTHKPTGTITLTSDSPVLTETYTTDREKNDKKREDMSWYFLFFIHI